MRFIADMTNYGPLEKAHLYALLASGEDLSKQVFPSEPRRVVSLNELQNDSAGFAWKNLL